MLRTAKGQRPQLKDFPFFFFAGAMRATRARLCSYRAVQTFRRLSSVNRIGDKALRGATESKSYDLDCIRNKIEDLPLRGVPESKYYGLDCFRSLEDVRTLICPYIDMSFRLFYPRKLKESLAPFVAIPNSTIAYAG